MDASAAAVSHAITPFWRRIPKFFLYPASPGPLVYILALSLVSAAGLLIIKILPPAIILVEFVVWAAFLKYAFVVLEHTSYGHLTPPSAMGELSHSEHNRPYKQIGVILLIGIAAGAGEAAFGPIAGRILAVFLQIVLPASIMLIAVNDNFFQALNPIAIAFIIAKIGWPYLAMCFFLLTISGGSDWLIYFLAPRVSPWLLYPMIHFISMYFALIMYNMMGYVLYQNHQALGLEVAVDFADSAESGGGKDGLDPLSRELNALLGDGDTEGAIDLLRGRLRQDWDSNDLHDRYHKLLVLAGKKEAVSHGREYIGKLVAEKKLGRAVDIYRDCLQVEPEFRPMEASQVYLLAATARDLRQFKLALAIMKQFDKRYPGHRDIPGVYLLSAKILHQEFRDERMARAILTQICRRYPDHPMCAEAKAYLALMDKLAAG